MVLETYKFKDAHMHLQFKEVSGIYALIHNNEVIYVGQSKDIRQRLMSHNRVDSHIKFYSNPEKCKCRHESSRINSLNRYTYLKENMNEILFLALPAPLSKLDELEKHYITKYKPKFNYAGVKTIFHPVKRKVS